MLDGKELTFRKIVKKYQQDRVLTKAMLSPSGVNVDGMPRVHSAEADSTMMRYEEAKDYMRIVKSIAEALDDPSSTIICMLLEEKSTTEIVANISYSRDYYYHKLRPSAISEFVDICPVSC